MKISQKKLEIQRLNDRLKVAEIELAELEHEASLETYEAS